MQQNAQQNLLHLSSSSLCEFLDVSMQMIAQLLYQNDEILSPSELKHLLHENDVDMTIWQVVKALIWSNSKDSDFVRSGEIETACDIRIASFIQIFCSSKNDKSKLFTKTMASHLRSKGLSDSGLHILATTLGFPTEQTVRQWRTNLGAQAENNFDAVLKDVIVNKRAISILVDDLNVNYSPRNPLLNVSHNS